MTPRRRRGVDPAPTGSTPQTSRTSSHRRTNRTSLTRPLRPAEVQKLFTDVWAFAVVIGAGPDGQPRVRRKLLLTAAAARKAVEDAHARGQTAACVLVRVSPVGGAAGGLGQGR